MTEIPAWIVIIVLLAAAASVVYLAVRFTMTVFLAATEKVKEKTAEKNKPEN